ncbi:hypothetical protein HH308_14385 [Gordonia sp. TBRC 11910]|uniref:Excreted virulence factor EspC (Type VII ESX diderm) n=1 Tax=Gordonia asplenii TaxID=2725283 RepID=A0A848L1B0_9ACTN|nr:hypothetical protein [Gordonia asplenii]NMO02403.1 hypothetical protein [Gordonia asplenii]
MTVWIDAGDVSAIATTYQEQGAALRDAATRLRAAGFGEWGVDPEIASFGAAFAASAATAADELARYASSTSGLGDDIAVASQRLVDADEWSGR